MIGPERIGAQVIRLSDFQTLEHAEETFAEESVGLAYDDVRAWRDRLATEVETLDVSIRKLTERRNAINHDRKRLSSLLQRPQMGGLRNGSDEWYVPAGEVARLLDDWKAADATRTWKQLSLRSGVSTRTIKSIRERRDSRHCQHVSFASVDMLTTAMGYTQEIHGLTLLTLAQVKRRSKERKEQERREAEQVALSGVGY